MIYLFNMKKQFEIRLINVSGHIITLEEPSTLEDLTKFILSLNSELLYFKCINLPLARTYEIVLNIKHIISIE